MISTGHHRSSIGTIGRASANEPTAGHVGSARSAQTSTPPPDASRRRTAFHPQQTSEQLPPHLSERLHSSDDEMAWNDRLGRDPAVRGLEAELRQSALLGHSLQSGEQPKSTHARRAEPASEERNVTITQSSGSRIAWAEPPHSLRIIGRLPNTDRADASGRQASNRPRSRKPREVSNAAEAGLWGLDRHE